MKLRVSLLAVVMLMLATIVSAQDSVTLDANTMGLIAGLFVTFFVVAIIMILAFYVYFAFVLMTLAKKTGTEKAWLAWIPVVNMYLLIKIAKLPSWWLFALLLPAIPFIGGVALYGIYIYWWWRIAEARKFPGWISLLMIIPVVNLAIMGVLAWGENK